MQKAGWKLFVVSALLSAAILQQSCHQSPETNVGTGGGGPTFGAGACRSCEKMACATEIAACEGEPECAGYIACEDACPIVSSGDVDAACAGACTKVSGSAAQAAFDAFQSCRAGAGCAACGQADAGSGGSGGGLCTAPPILTQTCSPSNETSACIKCQYEKCCDSVDAVFNGGPATDLANCWLACTTPQCENDCYQQFPDGLAGFEGYQACLFINCGATGACAISKACNVCQYQECSCEYATCMNDTDCFSILGCLTTCNDDPACGKDCVTAHPQAKAHYDTLQVCTAQHCIQQCGH